MARARDLVGAAATYSSKNFKRKSGVAEPDTTWQVQAWGYWEDTPEVRFAAKWIGHSMGRARLFAGRRTDDGSIEPLPPDHQASILVKSIAGGPTGQSQMLTNFGPHLVVAGEGWIIIEPHENYDPEWHLISVIEAKNQSGKLEVELSGRKVVIPMRDDEKVERFDPAAYDPTPLAIRVWEPHPRRHIEADSPIRSSFALLDELRLLNAAVAAIAKSRLTGRGIVFVPQGTKFPTAPGGGEAEDDFLDTLVKVAEIAYSEPDSAAAAVPIFVEVPADFTGQAQKMTFESEFDQIAIKLREETIRRFASSIDTPAEILLGMGDANHWSNWAIEESAIRIAVEPKLATVCDALTTQWLKPALDDTITDDIVVWYDASDLRIKTNRGQTALEMYDRGEITGDALRRETTFDDADKPNPAERREAIILGIIKNAPSLAPALLPLIGITIPTGPVVEEEVEVVEEPAPIRLPVDEETSPPAAPPDEPPGGEIMGSVDPGLLAASDALVLRALERAGQRYKSRTTRTVRGELNDVSPCAVHTVSVITSDAIDELGLLADAWDRVGEIADRYDVEPQRLQRALDGYCRDLITAGVSHCFQQMPAALIGVAEELVPS